MIFNLLASVEGPVSVPLVHTARSNAPHLKCSRRIVGRTLGTMTDAVSQGERPAPQNLSQTYRFFNQQSASDSQCTTGRLPSLLSAIKSGISAAGVEEIGPRSIADGIAQEAERTLV